MEYGAAMGKVCLILFILRFLGLGEHPRRLGTVYGLTTSQPPVPSGWLPIHFSPLPGPRRQETGYGLGLDSF